MRKCGQPPTPAIAARNRSTTAVRHPFVPTVGAVALIITAPFRSGAFHSVSGTAPDVPGRRHRTSKARVASRRELLLLLIGVDPTAQRSGIVSGITRLQKFLFLLDREENVRPGDADFNFEPYKAGPYSPTLYDDLELLENLGLIHSEGGAESTITESTDINRLSFEDLMGGFDELNVGPMKADSFEERRFTLTDKGRARIEKLLASSDHGPAVDGIRRLKSKYSQYSLRDLLRHVYRKFPDMTTESEIIDSVLGRKAR